MKTIFYNYWKTLCWAILIAILLFTSGDNLPKKNIFKIHHLDKYVHFTLFLALEILILIEFHTQKRNASLISILMIAFLPAVYAVFTELIQLYFISERNGEWEDFIADLIGIIAGFILFRFFKKRITSLS